jgi:hypothetical protein
VRDAARRAPGDSWAGFNVYYPMTEAEISASSGYDVIQGILGAFAEVLPVMNLVMQVSLSGPGSGTPSGKGKAERQSP